MEDEDLRNTMEEAKEYYRAFADKENIFFDVLKPSMLEEIPAVYAIFNKYTDECLYVGKTTNLRRRLYTNHLMGNLSTARLKKYLLHDADESDITTIEESKEYIISNCYFRYIEVRDMRRRGQLEGLFSFLLDVRYVDKEH